MNYPSTFGKISLFLNLLKYSDTNCFNVNTDIFFYSFTFNLYLKWISYRPHLDIILYYLPL